MKLINLALHHYDKKKVITTFIAIGLIVGLIGSLFYQQFFASEGGPSATSASCLIDQQYDPGSSSFSKPLGADDIATDDMGQTFIPTQPFLCRIDVEINNVTNQLVFMSLYDKNNVKVWQVYQTVTNGWQSFSASPAIKVTPGAEYTIKVDVDYDIGPTINLWPGGETGSGGTYSRGHAIINNAADNNSDFHFREYYSTVIDEYYYVTPDGNDLNDGSSWAKAYQHIARAFDGLDETRAGGPYRYNIFIKQGTYNESHLVIADMFLGDKTGSVAGIGVYGGFAGDEADLAHRHGQATIIDPNNVSRVLTISGSNNVVLDSLTLQNGNGSMWGNPATSGGALSIGGVDGMSLNHLIVKDSQVNFTSGSGKFGGGGIFVSGGSAITFNDVTVNNCKIFQNGSPSNNSLKGGGMYSSNVDGLTITNSHITNNSAPVGGGVFIQTSNQSFTATNNEFGSNTSTTTSREYGGGAISLLGPTQDFTIERNYIHDNTSNYGSAVHFSMGSFGHFNNNIVSHNHALKAGAMYLHCEQLSSCRWIAGNGEEVKAFTMDFNNNDFVDNYADNGPAAIYATSGIIAQLVNNIVAYNSGSYPAISVDPADDYSGSATNIAFQNGPTGNDHVDPAASTSLFFPSNLIGDPKFANRNYTNNPLAYQLTAQSTLAVDQGTTNSLTTDYSGNTRPHGPKSDIGAFEFQGSIVASQHVLLDLWSGINMDGLNQEARLLHLIAFDSNNNKVADTDFSMLAPTEPDKGNVYILPNRSDGRKFAKGETYTIDLSARGYLHSRKVVTMADDNQTGVDFLLTPGDADGNNHIGLGDLAGVLMFYNESGDINDEVWPCPNIDGSPTVGLGDMGAVLLYYGMSGDG